jgi:DNA-binding transcriptional ArsR family regulator
LTSFPKRRSEDVVTEELRDELVAYDTTTQTAHSLSRDAAAVWQECDGHTSAAEIAARLELDETTVTQALAELSAARLIDTPGGLSRRQATKRMAKLGAAALSAPLIYSVAVPPVSAAASLCTSNCAAGTVVPCGTGAAACDADPGQSGDADQLCATTICYQGATNTTCYCTSAPCSGVGSDLPCVGTGSIPCCAGDQFCGSLNRCTQ